MKKIYLILAAAVGMTLASCTSDEYVGTNNPYGETAANDGSIRFGFNVQGMTRADIVGDAAAAKLGNHFYVIGTKGQEETNSPSKDLVFDNYLVCYGINTAGKTASNTANWEYVGVTPGAASNADYAYLTSMSREKDAQTIKYWDYSTTQYDFHAFSTGNKKAVLKTDLSSSTTDTSDDVNTGEIGVTASQYGAGLASPTAYTFYIPELSGLQGAYITDITTVLKADYKKEVQLQFKNLGSKIRIALYETVPGYSIDASTVKFYTADADGTDASKPGDLADEHSTTAALISADANGFFEKGTIDVSFPNIGTSTPTENGNKNKAYVNVTPVAAATPRLYQSFGALDNKVAAEKKEAAGTNYIGRNITQATFAGTPELGYYQVVFPVSSSSPLTLRVDYQLVSTDGSGETIKVYGAKAVVPATYTVWQPNYAYTYIFKISDNTNGWTSTASNDPAGLFPITFDAVVQEVKDANAEQTTVTTVATPSITTYQQGHNHAAKDEYSNATGAKDIYVQVMDNENTTSPGYVGVSSTTKPLLNVVDPYIASKLYKVTTTGAAISEATVVDALENRTTVITSTDNNNLTGRNGITLTAQTNGANQTIDNTVTTIVNGVDDQEIPGFDAGTVAKIKISALEANASYAYVYDYGNKAKKATTIYQPKTAADDYVIPTTEKYITATTIDGGSATSAGDSVDDGYLYFQKTTDGTTTTYSYYSVDGKTTVPAGLLKVKVNDTNLPAGDGSKKVSEVSAKFVFDTYIRNDGLYAVKIIKIVE